MAKFLVTLADRFKGESLAPEEVVADCVEQHDDFIGFMRDSDRQDGLKPLVAMFPVVSVLGIRRKED